MEKIKKNKEKIIKFGFIFLSLTISLLIFYFRNSLSRFVAYGYAGIFLINMLGSATIAIPTPALVTTFIGGSIYNPLLVGLVSAVGNSLGELTGYMAGYGGRVLITENKNYKKVEKWMMKSGFLTIFILAAIPNPIFDLAGIFAGATNYPLKKYLLATFLGKIIKFTVISVAGYYIF